ncbi:MAG: transketolase [Vicinamibacterales bacterium]
MPPHMLYRSLDAVTLLPPQADRSTIVTDAAALSGAIRRHVIVRSKAAGVGHIGSALSIVDILAVLYAGYLRAVSPVDPDRDRFVLSKGHAALALYAALYERGWISTADLESYCTDGTRLGVHPERGVPGIDFSTGSLGHGLSFAAGAALAARLQRSGRRAIALVSDAECNEGSLWEAVMFAAHHRLDNLIALVDANGQQALGHTEHVLNLEPLERRWAAFGWDTRVVDGHDVEALTDALARCDETRLPHVVIARTTFGKGVSFMERQIKWHYWPMSDEEFQLALDELG